MKATKIIPLTLLAAAAGVSVFGYFAWQAVSVTRAEPTQALAEFTAVRSGLGGSEAMLKVNDAGQIVRQSNKVAVDGQAISSLKALAFKADEQVLAQVSVPFWFYKLKAPAIQFSLHDTDIDFNELGITASDLENLGPGLVLDEIRPNGDRVLIWTE